MAVTVTSFREYFDRGQFSFGVEPSDVREKDIEQAIAEADAVFNPDLYPHENIADLAKNFLIAHYLATDIDAADSGGQVRLLQNSRGADGVSESVSIPEWMNAGEFSFYATTYYGQKFLIISKPYLDGVVLVVSGGTQP